MKLEEALKKETVIMRIRTEFSGGYSICNKNNYHTRYYDGYRKDHGEIHTDVIFDVAPKIPLYNLDKDFAVAELNTLVETIVKELNIIIPTQGPEHSPAHICVDVGKITEGVVRKAEYMTHNRSPWEWENKEDKRTQEWLCCPEITLFEIIGKGAILNKYNLFKEFVYETKKIAELNKEKPEIKYEKITDFSILRRMEVRIYPSEKYFRKVQELWKKYPKTWENIEAASEEHLSIGSSFMLIQNGESTYWTLRVLTEPYNEYFKCMKK